MRRALSAARAAARRLRASGAVSGRPVEMSHARDCVVIPREHPVVDAEHHVGQREVFVARRRKALEHAAPVVREVARRAP